MKRSDYNKKPVKRTRREPTVFNLSNEKREQALQQRVVDLETDLQRVYTELKEMSSFKGQYLEATRFLEEKTSAIRSLKGEVEAQEESLSFFRGQMDKFQDAKKHLEYLTQRHDSLVTETTKLREQTKQFSDESNHYKELANTHENTAANAANEIIQFTETLALLENQNKLFENNMQQLTQIAETFEQKNIILNQRIQTKERERQILANDNKMARYKITELESVKVQLNNWNKELVSSTGEVTSKSSALAQKVNSYEKIMAEMGEYVENLIEDKDELVTLIQLYQKELNRPKYAGSASALSRKVGMPTSKENIRTDYLGTGVPTLLKFAEIAQSKEGKDGLTI